MLALSRSEGKELWELAVEYEMVRSGWSRQQVWDYMKYVVRYHGTQCKEALKGEIDMRGIISPTAGNVENYIKKIQKRWIWAY